MKKRLPRRTFLKWALTISILPHSFVLSSQKTYAQTQAISADLQQQLYGCSNAYKPGSDRSQTLSSMQALGCIYALSEHAGSTVGDREETFKQVKNIIQNQAIFDPGTFGVMSSLLKSEKLRSSDVEQYSNILGAGAQMLITGVVSPEGSVALSLGGVMVEPTFANLGANRFVITPSTDYQLAALSSWAYMMAMDKATQQQQFNAFFQSPEFAELTRTDPKVSLDESVSRLPDFLQTAVKRALQSSETEQEIMKEIQETTNRKLTDLKRQQQVLSAAIKEQQSEHDREVLQNKALVDFQRSMQEIQGAAQLGSTIISTVCRNPRAALMFQTSINSVGKVYEAMFLHSINKLGTLATLGTFFGATTTLFNVFTSTADSSTQIKEALDAVHEKLGEIQNTLGALEQRSVQILDGLNKIYEFMLLDYGATQVKITSIERQLRQQGQDGQQSFRDNDQALLGENIDRIKGLLRQDRTARDDLWRRDYAAALTFFYSFATRRSSSSHFTGNVNNPVSLITLANDFKSKPTIDLSFGLLPQIAGFAKIESSAVSMLTAGVNVPNPLCWAGAVNAYLEGRVGALDVRIDDDRVFLPEFWKMGKVIRQLAIELSSFPAIQAAVRLYSQELGNGTSTPGTLLGALYSALDDFEKKVTQPSYAVHSVPGYGSVNGETRYNAGTETTTYTVDNDPFQKCLDTGLLKKRITWADKVSTKRGVRDSCDYMLEITRGPDAGKLFLDGKVMCEDYSNFPSIGRNGINRSWDPERHAWPSRNPHEFLNASLDLIRRVDNHDTFKLGVVTAIETSLSAYDSTPLDGAALLVSFLSSIAILRMSGQFANEASFDIANAPVITKDSRLNVIFTAAAQKLNRNSSCRDQMFHEVKSVLDKELDDLLAKVQAVTHNDSIFILDETLRRVAGLMRVCDIPFQEVT